MDIFSLLPVILFIYAIFTIFTPGSKTPNNRRPNQNNPRQNQQYPNQQPSKQEQSAPKSWKERFEELERELFPKEPVPTKVSIPRPEPISEGYRIDYTAEGSQGIEGIGTEGYKGIEGSSGSEGTVGVEGSFQDRTSAVSAQTTTPRRRANQNDFPKITENSLKQGVIWAEVLGKPRALKKWSYDRK